MSDQTEISEPVLIQKAGLVKKKKKKKERNMTEHIMTLIKQV